MDIKLDWHTDKCLPKPLARGFIRLPKAKRCVALVVGAGLGICLLQLTGCFLSSHLRIEQVDYSGKQSPAAILIGDPQVYARASLINDRRQETEYLQQLLTNSEIKADGSALVRFSPQIVRDLKTVDALSASLGVSLGKSSPSSDLAAQVDSAQLQAQLAILQKQIQGIEAAAPPTVTIPAPNVSTTNASSSSTSPALSQTQTDIKNLQAQLQALAASGTSGPSSPSNSYGALIDPRDDLIDRQSYRRDVRAALAEAQLDDTHDWAGNALYRLQFQATVLPPNGSTKQWGVARLKIAPPKMSWDEVVQLYYSWLSHITSVLNNVSSGAEHDYNYDRFAIQIGAAGLFKVIDIYVDTDNDPDRYCFMHGTATDNQLRNIDGGLSLGFWGNIDPAHPDKPTRWYSKVGAYAIPPVIRATTGTSGVNAWDPAHLCASYTDWTATDLKPKTPKIPQEVWSFIASQIPGATSRYDSRRQSTISDYIGPYNASSVVPAAFCPAVVQEQLACPLDSSFGPAIVFTAKGGSTEVGDDYAVKSYSVLPAQLAQRLGVTTEASQSLQTAVSVAAQLSAAANAGVDAGYLAQADARAEALTRQPIVVGFAGTEPAGGGKGFFGWLFGPSFAVKDSKTLSLQQTVATYGVNADVSIPGWWGSFSLGIESSWISNWQSAELIADESKTMKALKRVNVPRFDAAFDALTDFMANEQHKASNGHIFVNTVTPNVLPACASMVTLQISGSNIWRANSALLSGVPAKQISVLPDMNGIAAQFDMSQVFNSLGNSDLTVQVMPLSIAAEQGIAATKKVYVIGNRQVANGVTTCQTPLLTPTDLGNLPATVVSSSPQSICTDTETFPLVLRGLNLPSDLVVKSGLFKSVQKGVGDQNIQMLMLTRISAGAKLTPRTETIAAGPAAGPYAYTVLDIKDCSTTKQGGSAGSDTSAKATLVTTSVKLAKDQKVELKVDIPDSYSNLTIAVRPQVPKATPSASATVSGDGQKAAQAATDKGTASVEPTWVESASITNAKSGKSSDVVGTIDLTNAAAQAGDKLEVRVEITLRPNTLPQIVAANKALTVDGGSAGEASPAKPSPAAPAKTVPQAKK
jgi:hypothetical protein